MSQENVDVVRAIYDAYQRNDIPAVFEHFHDDVEWFGPPDVSGIGLTQGHEGVRHSLDTWLSAWDEHHFELLDLRDTGDRVLATGRQRGRGKGSGIEVSEEIFSVWTLRSAKVVRQRMFRDRAQALEATGLSG